MLKNDPRVISNYYRAIVTNYSAIITKNLNAESMEILLENMNQRWRNFKTSPRCTTMSPMNGRTYCRRGKISNRLSGFLFTISIWNRFRFRFENIHQYVWWKCCDYFSFFIWDIFTSQVWLYIFQIKCVFIDSIILIVIMINYLNHHKATTTRLYGLFFIIIIIN